jgi:hypothetical protein
MREMHVVLYEKPTTDRICPNCRIHHASTPWATFDAGIWDAAQQALMALRSEKAQTLRGSKFCHFLSKLVGSSEVYVHFNVHDNPSGCLKEQVHLTKAMDHALAEAIQEIEDLHKHYEEQELVIKDRDNLIIELLDKDEDSNDNSNNNSDDEGNDEGSGDGIDGSECNMDEVPE